jgi:hypothetical protein
MYYNLAGRPPPNKFTALWGTTTPTLGNATQNDVLLKKIYGYMLPFIDVYCNITDK